MQSWKKSGTSASLTPISSKEPSTPKPEILTKGPYKGIAEASSALFTQGAMDPPALMIRKGNKGIIRIIVTEGPFLEVHKEGEGVVLVPTSNVRHLCLG